MVDYTNPGDVQTDDVVAHPTGAVLEAPRSNSALQLAQSLQDTTEKLPGLLQGIAQVQQGREQAKANAAALANSGQAFADAVRAGKIEPTQNPWFIQAYEKDAAQVRAQGQVSDLLTQSQQWAERNDPTAYTNRFNTELGKIAQGYQGIDQSAGFQKAAQPLREQALNANVAYNVKRITDENTQNATTLATSAIEQTLQANPKASPDQIFAATEEGHRQWLATGGTEPEWNRLLVNSVVGAASNRGDSSLLEVLKDNRGGKGALADIADETGKPIGAQLDQYAYMIDRRQQEESLAAVRAHDTQVTQEAFNVTKWAQTTYGEDWFYNRVPENAFKAAALKAGFSQDGINRGVQQQAAVLQADDTFSRAQIEQHSLDPTISTAILSLHSRAMKDGSSPALENDVFDRVARGDIERREGEQILAEARQQSNYLTAQGRAERSEAKADARDERRLNLESAQQVAQLSKTAVAEADVRLTGAGDPVLSRNASQRIAIERAANDAARAAYAKTNDINAAKTAAEQSILPFVSRRVQLLKRGLKSAPPTGDSGATSNPRGN